MTTHQFRQQKEIVVDGSAEASPAEKYGGEARSVGGSNNVVVEVGVVVDCLDDESSISKGDHQQNEKAALLKRWNEEVIDAVGCFDAGGGSTTFDDNTGGSGGSAEGDAASRPTVVVGTTTTATAAAAAAATRTTENAPADAAAAAAAADYDESSSAVTKERLEKSIFRYVKWQDQYMAMVSVLLKSRAYYQYHHCFNRSHSRRRRCRCPHSAGGQDEQQAEAAATANYVAAGPEAGGGNNLLGRNLQRLRRRGRPVVDLPRTEYRKPYIPLRQTKQESRSSSSCAAEPEVNDKRVGDDEVGIDDDKDHDDDAMNSYYYDRPFSVSHQFPFVGIARRKLRMITTSTTVKAHVEDSSSPSTESSSSSELLLLGFDIVVFEFNSRMYQDEKEFVDVFSDSFAQNEWQTLLQSAANNRRTLYRQRCGGSDILLREFYLRWAAKEAYTKALGIGLGFDFSSFQIHFELDGSSLYQSLVDNATSAPSSNVSTQKQASGKYISVQARIEWMEDATRNEFVPKEGIAGDGDDRWYFIFSPLYTKEVSNNNSSQNQGLSDDSPMVGCACSCIGPFRNQQTTIRLEVERMTLDSLIKFHTDG